MSRSPKAEGSPRLYGPLKDEPVEYEYAVATQGEEDGPKVEKEEGEPLPARTKRSATPATPVPPQRKGPQLIGDLPVARPAALATFEELRANHYQYGTLGRSREALEGMICDCTYEHGADEPWAACGDGSDCINRLTQVECLSDECKCGGFCKNQRFNRKEYAPIEIVQTEKKGFGLRAEANIPKDAFIYEYVGDVVSHPSFKKRMRDYAAEGIRHFYFMMLQKDEYIDATKRGGIGRFANHSCSPNCYVAKWTVGAHVRIGIFAKRKIQKHEELTFNYNVDRYGHEAQPCYCGEPNCVGFLGGKTQTDVGAMDDLYLDALGITDEVEALGLKGSKKRKGKKLDEDYIPDLKPLMVKDVPKVIQALRQTTSPKVLFKLLTRIKLTEDPEPLRHMMRLRGFSQMTIVLKDYEEREDISAAALECMYNWPLLKRNKVEASGVEQPVKKWAESDNERLKALAQKLLDKWSALETAYRIAKRDGADARDDYFGWDEEYYARPRKRVRGLELNDDAELQLAPVISSLPSSRSLPHRKSNSMPTPVADAVHEATPAHWGAKPADWQAPTKQDISAVIAAAARAEAERKAAEVAQLAEAARKAEERARRREERKGGRKALGKEEKEALKEKRLQKLVGAVVVKYMSKYRDQMESELFKKHARELTQVIADKEKKSSSYRENRLDTLSDEKTAKIKKFAKEYIAKVLRKLEKAGQAKRKGAPGGKNEQLPTPATTSTPDSPGAGEDAEMSLGAVFGDELMDVDDEDDDDGGGDSPVKDVEMTTPPSTMDPRRRHDPDERPALAAS